MFVDKIFERATIRGIADYLLFGQGSDEDDRSYEERLDEPYMRFEKAVEKYDKSKTSELLDLCNEVSSETASVYMEIGLQAGILLMVDVIKNIHVEKKISFTDFVNRDEVFNGNETLLDAMYKEWVDGEYYIQSIYISLLRIFRSRSDMQKIRPDMDIGHNIQRLRRSTNMTQDQVVAQLQLMGIEISKSTYAKLETNRMNIKVSELIALSKIFDADIAEFFFGLL